MIAPDDARDRDAALARARDGGADHALSVVRTIAAIMGDNELALFVSNALVRITEKRAADMERDFDRMGWASPAIDNEPDASAPHASAVEPPNEHASEPDAGDFEGACIVLADAGAILEVWARGVPMRAELHRLVRWALAETRAHIATVNAPN